jgi:hypothetical protein
MEEAEEVSWRAMLQRNREEYTSWGYIYHSL